MTVAKKSVSTLSGAEHIAAMKLTKELLTFEESMAALRQAGGCAGRIWPELSGNDLYAFANAAAFQYAQKMKEQP